METVPHTHTLTTEDMPEEDMPAEEVVASQLEEAHIPGAPEVLKSQAEQADIAPAADPALSPAATQEAPYPLPRPGQSKRRERLLELARYNAQQSLPASVFPPPSDSTEEEQRHKHAEEEKARARAAKDSIRQRLWRLMGGSL